MKNLDALLVLPPMYQSGRVPDHNPKEPMGLMYISANLRKNGYSVEILDADILALTIEQAVEEIIRRPAKIIGFSIMQRALASFKLLMEKLSQRGLNAHICCGGFAATLSAEHILKQMPAVDSIVLGEGEDIFYNLTKAIKESRDWKNLAGIAFRQDGKVFFNKPAKKPEIKKLAWPSRDLLPICLEKTNYATVMASRGCYGGCTFCSNQAFEDASEGPRWRGRECVDVVDEIEELKEKYNVKIFKFNDPNLFGPGSSGKKHVVDLCGELISRDLKDIHLMGFCRSNDVDLRTAQLMRKAGFERVLMGIESSSPKILNSFRKGETLQTICKSIRIFRQVGIDIVPGFMIFNPYSTIETLEKDLDFLDIYEFMPILAKSLKIFDGTPLQKIMDQEKRLIWCDPFEGYHEYTVDSSVASIYMALKMVFVEWIDLLRKSYQNEIWKIKKAPAFNKRMNFDILNKMIFALEKRFLRTLINWARSGFRYSDINDEIAQIKKQLIEIERHIISASGLTEPILNVKNLSVSKIAQKIYSILSEKNSSTLPEEYRWRED